MSILQDLPHVCTPQKRTRTRGSTGGRRDSYTTVATDTPCWRQVATAKEVETFDKRGISVSAKIYFTSDPGLDEQHILSDVRDKDATSGSGDTLEVRTKSIPDASVGLGVVYKLFAEISTEGTTPT